MQRPPEKPRSRPGEKAAPHTNTTTSITGDAHVYAVGDDGRVVRYRITRRTPKRVYFEVSRIGETVFDVYVSREALERGGSAEYTWEGRPHRVYAIRATARKAASRARERTPGGTAEQAGTEAGTDLIPAGITAIMPPADSARNDSGSGSGDGAGDLWAELAATDWSSSANAYTGATAARRIIEDTPMTVAAFAAECKRQNITGWQSQGSVSRRLRWANLHDECWRAGILPMRVFLSESATRPLFDGKLTKAQRLKLLAELFGPHLTEEQKRKLAAELSEALMREHLARHGDSGPEYKAPRIPVLDTTVAKLLIHYPAEAIKESVDRQDNSARNAAGTGAAGWPQ